MSLAAGSPHRPRLSPGSCLTTGLRGCPACVGVRSWRRCECEAGPEGGAGRHADLPHPAGDSAGPGQAELAGNSPGAGAETCLRPLGARAEQSEVVIRAGQGAAAGRQGPWLSFSTNAHSHVHTHTRTHAHTCVQEGTCAAGSTRTEPCHRLSELLFPQRGACRLLSLHPGARQGGSCCPKAQGPPLTQTPVRWALLLEEGLEGPQGEVSKAGSQAPGNPGNSLPWSHRDGL